MGEFSIVGAALGNMPWQDRPARSSGAVWRYDGNPITGWNPTNSTARIYNSAVVGYEGAFVGVFRADHRDGRANLHLGRSRDGIRWDIEDETIRWEDEQGDPFDPLYAYDPRLVRIGDTFYIMWCTEFGGGPSIGLGMTKDFRRFVRLDNAFLPCNRNGVLFPRRINGMYRMLSRPSDTGHTPFGDIFVSESPDLIYWGRHRKVMSRSASGWWQGLKIGAGPVPIETTEGWLLIYHGVINTCNGYVYSMGAALLDIDEPSRVILRTRDYLLTPEMPYETTGFVPNVAFPCAALCDAPTGRIALYYGAADTHVAVAFTTAGDLYQAMSAHSDLAGGDADLIR